MASASTYTGTADMTRDMLANGLQELALLIRRDGTLLAHFGGRGVEWLCPPGNASAQPADGPSLHSLWPRPFADLVLRLARRSIATRRTLDAEFRDGERCCEVQVTAQSPDRVICTVRAALGVCSGEALSPASAGRERFDRRGFMRRFNTSLSMAALNEKPLAVAIIEFDGMAALAQVLDNSVSEQVLSVAIARLPVPDAAVPDWYLGQLSQRLLVVVLETSNRDLIETCMTRICSSFRAPVQLGDAKFHLDPHVGVAMLGRDATSPKVLLDHARASAVEARRAGDWRVCFFSDTLKLRSLARLDATQELHDAIANGDIRLRYVPRHDLGSGRLVALVAYLQWLDPLRGEVRPREFLGVAEATGLSVALSRSALESLREDFMRLRATVAPEVRVSFGALRQHVLNEGFVTDIQAILGRGGLTADRLELRISERAYVSRDAEVWHGLANIGVQLVVDEFGRDMSSLDLLARVPLWGLQLDRSLTTAVIADPVASRVCRAVVNVAAGLGLVPIATGIDSEAQRARLAAHGCRQGLGDLFAAPEQPGRVSSNGGVS